MRIRITIEADVSALPGASKNDVYDDIGLMVAAAEVQVLEPDPDLRFDTDHVGAYWTRRDL